MPESRFDHDSEESGEDMEDEEDEEGEDDEDEAGDGDPTPQSQTHSRSPTPQENYIPDSPPVSPVELKKELPKYLPALQVCSTRQRMFSRASSMMHTESSSTSQQLTVTVLCVSGLPQRGGVPVFEPDRGGNLRRGVQSQRQKDRYEDRLREPPAFALMVEILAEAMRPISCL